MNRRPASLSVIIPALNEAAHLTATLASLRSGRLADLIVVDGGSQDQTVALAQAAGATVLSSPPGRSRQQNLGAAAASGDVLFFLHADTLAPPHYDRLIFDALAAPGVSAGAFSLSISGSTPALRLISALANRRSRWLQLPYGDQGLFLRTSLFRSLGGFPDLPIMEDLALVRRLRRCGRILTLPQPVCTSGRRWHHLGPLRTTAINQLMLLGFALGLDPHTLARLYRQAGRPRPQANGQRRPP
jgi:rSAM/selenodomain-associated transferase 2